MTAPAWLPPLVELPAYGGDWARYVEAVYQLFRRDFVDSLPQFRGAVLRLKWWPTKPEGREATFWHFVSEGEVEAERTPDLRRCERICWPRPVIEHEAEPEVRVWEERKHGETRIHLWFEQESYLVVIARRQGYYIPWTAYWVEQDHQKRKLNRRWEQYR